MSVMTFEEAKRFVNKKPGNKAYRLGWPKTRTETNFDRINKMLGGEPPERYPGPPKFLYNVIDEQVEICSNDFYEMLPEEFFLFTDKEADDWIAFEDEARVD